MWYLSESPQLSATALNALDQAVQAGTYIYIAAITMVELAYLVEREKLAEGNLNSRAVLLEVDDNVLRLAPLDGAVARALRRVPRSAIPDMPDRIIAATALHLQVPLVTRDSRIRAAPVSTIW
jgi:PIN domain nuclease of toxin-antitoxin system